MLLNCIKLFKSEVFTYFLSARELSRMFTRQLSHRLIDINRRHFGEAAHVLGTIVPGTLNVSHKINELRGRKLHLNPSNPICIIKNHIFNHLNQTHGGIFVMKDDLNEVVTTKQNFEDLLIPSDHPSRRVTDTYYIDEGHLLRPQTSAHQTEMYRNGHKAFLVVGDCYRKDTIDGTHYPIFHQMEGVRIWKKTEMSADDVERDLKATLDDLVSFLFPGNPTRWADDYFPFTDPSFEMEVQIGSTGDDEKDWLEIFGSGVIHQVMCCDQIYFESEIHQNFD